jgi:hypothetical protein
MAVVETIFPDADVADGSWLDAGGGSILYDDLDESGAHDGDTSYVRLIQSVAGTTTSEFEVALQNPTKWLNALNVRDAETWKAVKDLQVRDAEAWKKVKVLQVRDVESWKMVIPRVTVRVTAKRINNLANDPISGTAKLKAGTTEIATASLSLTDGVYVETSFSVDAGDLAQYDPTDLRGAVSGSVTVTSELDGPSELRVTQIKVELED